MHFLNDPIHANFYDLTSRTCAAVNLQKLIATKPDNKSPETEQRQNLKPKKSQTLLQQNQQQRKINKN